MQSITVKLPEDVLKIAANRALNSNKKLEEYLSNLIHHFFEEEAEAKPTKAERIKNAIEESRIFQQEFEAELRKKDHTIRSGLSRNEIIKKWRSMFNEKSEDFPFKSWQEADEWSKGKRYIGR